MKKLMLAMFVVSSSIWAQNPYKLAVDDQDCKDAVGFLNQGSSINPQSDFSTNKTIEYDVFKSLIDTASHITDHKWYQETDHSEPTFPVNRPNKFEKSDSNCVALACKYLSHVSKNTEFGVSQIKSQLTNEYSDTSYKHIVDWSIELAINGAKEYYACK